MKRWLFFKESPTLRNIDFFPQSTSFFLEIVLFEEISTLSNKASHFNPHLFELIHMITTLERLAGINEHVKYQICSWQSGQKNTSWIAPGGGEHIYIYIYRYPKTNRSKYIYIYIKISDISPHISYAYGGMTCSGLDDHGLPTPIIPNANCHCSENALVELRGW